PESVYAEFVAVYLTMRRFDPARVPHFFPALRDVADVDALIAEDIDADAIYQATRLLDEEGERGRKGERETPSDGSSLSPSPLLPFSPSSPQEASLDHLSDRLKKALELSDADAAAWRQALAPLAAQAGEGSWTQEARFLHDLQNACTAGEDS